MGERNKSSSEQLRSSSTSSQDRIYDKNDIYGERLSASSHKMTELY